jgi:hypothetical protein
MPAKNLYVENCTGQTLYLVLVVSRGESLLTIHVYDEDPGVATDRNVVPDGQAAQFPSDGAMADCIVDGQLNYALEAHLNQLERIIMTGGRYRMADGPIIQLEAALN